MNNNHVSANGIHDEKDGELSDTSFDLENSIPDPIELIRRGVWSRLFRSENTQPKINSHSHHSPTLSNYDLLAGRFHYVPFDKRTIPIELQKALYAHGIVGRRR